MVAHRESARLAERLIAETCKRQKIVRDQLTLHADRGSSMRSKPVAMLLSDLGVTKTHSRPHVSNDNPMSEAQFKTLKYRPDYPERFGGVEHARAHHVDFFDWYNREHHHSALALLTPYDVHHGHGDERIRVRQTVLAEAHAAHPERFPLGLPRHIQPPTEVWINRPASLLEGGRPPQAQAGSSDTPKGVAPPTLVDEAQEPHRPTGALLMPPVDGLPEGVPLQ